MDAFAHRCIDSSQGARGRSCPGVLCMDGLSALSYEQAYEKLEQTVAALQDGHLSLEDALTCYEEGMKLAQYCHTLLQQAELRVQQVQVTDEGELEIKPLDLA
jgi:exodeoxyribonuclease VII small subunit